MILKHALYLYQQQTTTQLHKQQIVMTTTAQHMQIAETIQQQLGGNRFIAMTGSKNFMATPQTEKAFAGLRMDLKPNQSGANRLHIYYNTRTDSYDMYFYKGTLNKKTFDYKITKEQRFNDVYCDQLQCVFTQVTGMYTTLAPVLLAGI